MLNIQPQKADFMNCYEGIIVAFAKWLGVDYELMFADSWGFKFLDNNSEEDNLLGKRISTHKEIHWDYLEIYHGIESKDFDNKTPSEILDVIRKQLIDGYPTVIFVNSYWYPWNDMYKKFNNSLYHAIMVTGIDENEKFLYCTDTTFMKYNEILTFEDFAGGTGTSCITLSYTSKEGIKIDWKSILKESILKLKLEEKEGKMVFDDFRQMRRFAEEVENNLDLEKETREYKDNIWIAPIIFKVSELINGRVNYANLLKYIASKGGEKEFEQIAEKMKEAFILWESIRGMLIKGCYTTIAKGLNGRIANKIMKVADIEEYIAELILEISNSNSDNFQLDGLINKRNSDFRKIADFTFINLDNYFNNKSFGDPSKSEYAGNMSGLGYFMYIDDLAKQKNWEAESMKFLFPDVTGMNNDSIACNGQTIELPRGRYYSIMFLGCSDLGSFSEEMTIEYENYPEQKLNLQFSNHGDTKQSFEETLMWRGKCGFPNQNNNGFESKIYAKTYMLEHDKFVKSLKLPICTNILIFGISLGRL